MKYLQMTSSIYKALNDVEIRKMIVANHGKENSINILYNFKDIHIQHCLNRKQYLVNQPYILDYINGEKLDVILKKYKLSNILFYEYIDELGIKRRYLKYDESEK